MNIADPTEVIMHIAQVDYEQFTVVRQVLRSPDGSKRSPLIFCVNGEHILWFHDISSMEAAQSELDSTVIRSVLGMTEEDVEAISRMLPELFGDEVVYNDEEAFPEWFN